ncbi:hypothetical protein AAY473_017137 [Plecturocebus cupreus]
MLKVHSRPCLPGDHLQQLQNKFHSVAQATVQL